MGNSLLICILFNVIIVLFSFIGIVYEYIQLKKKFDKKVQNVELTGKLSEIVLNSYKLFDEKLLIGLPNVRKYLFQAEYIIMNKPFNLFELKLATIKEKRKDEKEPKELIVTDEFIKELYRAPQSVKSLVDDLNEILWLIYKQQHPIGYCEITIKKNVYRQILRILHTFYQKKSNNLTAKKYKDDDKNKEFGNLVLTT